MSDDYNEGNKLMRKMKSDPAVPIGLVGLTGVVLYSLYNLKRRKEKLSLYLIHTRVIAQGTLMASITLGLIYTIGARNWNKFFPEKKN